METMALFERFHTDTDFSTTESTWSGNCNFNKLLQTGNKIKERRGHTGCTAPRDMPLPIFLKMFLDLNNTISKFCEF